MAYKLIFNGRFHTKDNCMCDCCNDVGNVFILNFQKTYNKHGKLQTEDDTHIWMCDDCRQALTTFLKEADKLKEKKNDI